MPDLLSLLLVLLGLGPEDGTSFIGPEIVHGG